MLIPIAIAIGLLVLSKKTSPVTSKDLIAAPQSKPVIRSAPIYYQSENSSTPEPVTKQSVGFIDRQIIEDMHNHNTIKGVLTNRIDTLKNGNNYSGTVLSSISDENDNSFEVAAVPLNPDVNNRPLLGHSFHLYSPLDSSDMLHAPVYHDAAASIAPLPPKQNNFQKVLAIIQHRVATVASLPDKSVTNPNAQLTKFNSLRELYGRN